ncbi:MAG: hypothetical protein ABJB98_09010 [Actinomycetota bacterium]
MDVELLVVSDCPHQDAALRLLRTGLTDVGLSDTAVRTTVITSQAEAERRGFTGSPTFLLDGVDPFAARGQPAGLSCRVYRGVDGTAGVPALTEVRQALKRAADAAAT